MKKTTTTKKKSTTKSKSKSKTTKPKKPAFPFLFVGQGFGTSYKCLEGYLWFEKPPNAKQQKKIVALLPLPILLEVRFAGAIMHFGSDDRLEGFVRAAYAKKYAKRAFEDAVEELEALWDAGNDDDYQPTRAEWKAFCDHFERAVIAIHKISKLFVAHKPDDGQGFENKPGPWHRWSVANATPVAVRALGDKKKTSRDLAYLAVNLAQDVVENAKLSGADRTTWGTWLDRLAKQAPSELKSAFVDLRADLDGDDGDGDDDED